jgi:hypothetical protein
MLNAADALFGPGEAIDADLGAGRCSQPGNLLLSPIAAKHSDD